jgi:3-deoxy-7-phosphoheptulonate synthase
LYDPDLDGSDDLEKGLERARALMVKIAGLGLPIATEILDPIAAEYLADCVSWVAIGARTSESQIHRQLASRLECPVGFKNGTDGSVEIAAQAMQSAAAPHTHLGIDHHGRVAMKRSPGNSATHVVLRGGATGPNYDRVSVAAVVASLRAQNQNARVLVDCSHGNSEKNHNRQPLVARDVFAQLASGNEAILGVMIESHLRAGKQSVDEAREYGVSVTDACIDFATTEALLLELAGLGAFAGPAELIGPSVA